MASMYQRTQTQLNENPWLWWVVGGLAVVGFGALFALETQHEQQILASASRRKRPFKLPPGRELFKPTFEWQIVQDKHILPSGPNLEVKMDMQSGKNMARLKRG